MSKQKLVTKVTDDNWKETVEEHNGRVLVDFWASWCGPCNQVKKVVKEIARDFKGDLKVCHYKLTDDNLEIAEELEIKSIPTLALFKDGEMIDFVVGMSPKKKIEERLKL